jgi:hypothetical protein
MPNYSSNLDTIFHALADPTRRAVIERIGPAFQYGPALFFAAPESAGKVRTAALAEGGAGAHLSDRTPGAGDDGTLAGGAAQPLGAAARPA